MTLERYRRNRPDPEPRQYSRWQPVGDAGQQWSLESPVLGGVPLAASRRRRSAVESGVAGTRRCPAGSQ